MYGFKIVCEISMVTFEISHTILNPCTAKYSFYEVLTVWRIHVRFMTSLVLVRRAPDVCWYKDDPDKFPYKMKCSNSGTKICMDRELSYFPIWNNKKNTDMHWNHRTHFLAHSLLSRLCNQLNFVLCSFRDQQSERKWVKRHHFALLVVKFKSYGINTQYVIQEPIDRWS